MSSSTIVQGDLLDQDVDVIVNPWNRNIFPWWLLLPAGVAGAIRRTAGVDPFRELSAAGLLPLGAAVLTSAGRLPFKGIIHVAGINLLWRASERSIRLCVENALAIVDRYQFSSVAIPIIGAGTGGVDERRALAVISDTVANASAAAKVVIVVYDRSS